MNPAKTVDVRIPERMGMNPAPTVDIRIPV